MPGQEPGEPAGRTGGQTDKQEVEEWKKRGPIHSLTRRLKAEEALTEAQFLEIDARVLREVDEAVAFAEAGTWEPVEDLAKDVVTR